MATTEKDVTNVAAAAASRRLRMTQLRYKVADIKQALKMSVDLDKPEGVEKYLKQWYEARREVMDVLSL